MFTGKRTLNSILKILDKAAEQLEEFIQQKDDEALDSASRAQEHQERASAAIQDREKASRKLVQIRNLTSL